MSLSEVQLPAAYRRHVLLTVQLVVLAALLTGTIVATFTYSLYVRLFLLGAFVLIVASWWLTWHGKESGGAVLLLGTVLALTTLLALRGQGLNDIALSVLPALLILGGLVLAARQYLVLVVLVFAAVLMVTIAVSTDVTQPTRVKVPNPWGEAAALLVILTAEAAMVQILVRGIRRFFAEAEKGRLAVQNEMLERLQAEQAVRELNAELEARVVERTADLQTLIGELESFNYSVSHDLRAPLRAILGFGQMAAEDLPPDADASRQHLQRATAAARRMGELIDDLLRLSRTSTQELQLLPRAPVAVVNEVLQQLPDSERACVKVLDRSHDEATMIDVGLLRLALTNLISNAIKYSRDKQPPAVEISIDCRDIGVVICVQDNGIGFDPADADRLFKPFSRLANAGAFDGTGVGLAIVRRVAERLHGRVWAQSSSGAGARFYLALPLAVRKSGTAS